MANETNLTAAGFLAADRLELFLDALGKSGRVLVPTVGQDGAVDFAPRGSGRMDLSRVNTRTSAKNLVFPQSEPLFAWCRPPEGDVKVEEPPAPGPQVLFGVRPCDARALRLLDALFIESNQFDQVNKDAGYAARRKAVGLVGVGCATCDPTCFCASFDFSPAEPRDCDLFLTPLGQGFLVETVTARGRELAALTADALTAAPADGRAQAEAVGQRTRALQKRVPDLAAAARGLDKEDAFDQPFWKRLAETCLGCQACTYLCPTCHCYELRDEGPRGSGLRYRLHDSCMSEEFTRHASGHNPREKPFKRWRQRAFHKFSWFPKNLGAPLCVGCGRCTLHCPVGVDLTAILEEVSSF